MDREISSSVQCGSDCSKDDGVAKNLAPAEEIVVVSESCCCKTACGCVVESSRSKTKDIHSEVNGSIISRPLIVVLMLLIKFYRKFISPCFPPCCRFTPTCSQYALIALRRHGLLKGGILTIWRIIRCNPLCKGGVDEVPPLHRWR